MKKKVVQFSLLLFVILLHGGVAICQISLVSFKKLASDDQNFQADFLERNKYVFDSNDKSSDGKYTRYHYFKDLSNSEVRKIVLIPELKIVLWATTSQAIYNSQKAKLTVETFTNPKDEEITNNINFSCLEEVIGDIKFDNPVEKEGGISSIFLLKSGYLLMTLPFKEGDATVYLIALVHPNFCAK